MNGMIAVIGTLLGYILGCIVTAWLMNQMHAHERALWDRALALVTNALTIGTPTPHEAIVTHEPDAEERVRAQIASERAMWSEETIERGMRYLRDQVYAGQAVEDDVLRAEVFDMLAGQTPTVAEQWVRD